MPVVLAHFASTSMMWTAVHVTPCKLHYASGTCAQSDGPEHTDYSRHLNLLWSQWSPSLEHSRRRNCFGVLLTAYTFSVCVMLDMLAGQVWYWGSLQGSLQQRQCCTNGLMLMLLIAWFSSSRCFLLKMLRMQYLL